MPDLRRRSVRFRAALIASLFAANLLAPAAAEQTEAGARLPRFASLRSDRVNLRVGPGENYPIEWVLTRKDLPVEIVKEFEHWRMIRDWQGTQGWVHERMLAGKRQVIVKGAIRALHRRPDAASPVTARAEPGVIARLMECQGPWCRIETPDAGGWVQRSEIWGVYPDEKIE
jgi:SH3-like domain-containing protein